VFVATLPETRSERWALLARVIAHWFPAWRGGQGVRGADLLLLEQHLGRPLPAALREWYERQGARADVWSLQDTFLMRPLQIDRDVVVVGVENQAVVRWGIRLEDLSADDPPIVVSDPDGATSWLVESPTTSAFAIQLAFLNVKWSRAVSYRANGQGTDEALVAIDRGYPRLPCGDIHWPAWPTRMYSRDDIVIETNGDTWIWASARSPEALTELDAVVREAGMQQWESYED
jgi:hypothetical protein